MRRVKRYLDARASDSHERWLVSYADFITLLFAFFVVMYAISSVNEGKYRVLGSAIGSAFSIAPPPRPQLQGGALRAPTPQARHRERVASITTALRGTLAPLVAEGLAKITPHGRGVSIEIGAGALFAPGQAALRDEARAVMLHLAEILRFGNQPIEVEGHTDDTPIRNMMFPTNWELSAARAASVVRLLAQQGVAPERLAAIGYGEFRPLEPNATPEARARNRRVLLTLVMPEPSATAAAEPALQTFPPMEFPVRGR